MATILVVDPSRSVRETVRIVLGAEHEVSVAESLAEAPAHPSCDLLVVGLPPAPREARALATALARLAPEAPVLLLDADIEVDRLVAPQRPRAVLAKPFDAHALRARVRELLRVGPVPPVPSELAELHARYLQHPYLTRAASALARRAIAADVPVMLEGESGTGASAVARALHVLAGGRGAYVEQNTALLGPGDLAAAVATFRGGEVGTLVLHDVERAAPAAQRELLGLLEGQATTGAPLFRLIATATSLATAVECGGFLPELATRLATVPIALAPLRDRRDELPALVATLTTEIAARLRLGPVSYSDAALARLGDYLWFGNVVELEATLTRTLALHQPKVVDAEHIVFMPEDAPRALAREGATRPRPRPLAQAAVVAGPNLEILLGELAHELKNPMVTIKTFASHLDGVLADPEMRERFASLTAEAVTRMDGVLETLLEFARFRAPVPQPIAVGALVDQAVAEHASELAQRGVAVERNGDRLGTVDVDEAQVSFALRQLVGGLIATAVPHSPLAIHDAGGAGLELRLRAEPSVAARLAAWVSGGDAARDAPSLAWALADTLLRRNGAALSVHGESGGTTVVRIEWAGRAVPATG